MAKNESRFDMAPATSLKITKRGVGEKRKSRTQKLNTRWDGDKNA